MSYLTLQVSSFYLDLPVFILTVHLTGQLILSVIILLFVLFIRQPPSLKQLIHLYVGRTSSCWKAPECIAWLEENVTQCCHICDTELTR